MNLLNNPNNFKFRLVKNSVLAIYVYYMLNHFKTTYYFHHPLEIWLQNISVKSYLKHPIRAESYNSKVCPLGNLVGKIFALYLIIRTKLPSTQVIRLNRFIWSILLVASFIMNLNVFSYLIIAYLFDINC